ncbi:MAG: type V CRISPR-associated protein Cas12a/Cpf1, partial [Verrucomicrobia bacterium]|nr:type V CRISPR-associated protein Cas12a/Cpf1 [Verrucomicrobiota bacterium]
LYKQVLSDRGTISYIPPAFTSDTELLTAIRTFWNGSRKEEIPAASAIVKQITELFAHIQDYDPAGLFIAARSVTSLSHKVYGSWDVLREGLGSKFGDDNKSKSKSYSLKELQEAGNAAQDYAVSLSEKIKSIASSLKLLLENAYKAAKVLIDNKGDTAVFNGKISAKVKESNITLIREFLDSVKDFQQWAKLLTGTGKESGKDESFYSQFSPLYDILDSITPLYNKVRNYLTKKPYSTDKIKLNFDNPTFLGGWAVKKEVEYSAQILRSLRSGSKNEYDYYLLVMDKEHKAGYKNEDLSVSPKKEYYEKMVYNQVASPTKDIPTLMYVNGKAIKTTGKKVSKTFKGESIDINPRLEAARKQYWPKDIYRIFTTQSYKPDTEPDKKLVVCENDAPKEIQKAKYSRKDLETLIDYFQKLISDYLTDLTFHFKPAKEYQTYQEFLDHTKQQGYQVEFKKVSKEKINALVKEGHIYLFQIYSKDFSPFSTGTPNMHTLYFKALFDKANLNDVTFKLSGGAEMFYREASIPREVTHPKNRPIGTKNPLNPVKKKTFDYDLIKDKRYTEDQFMLHIPIALNFKAGKTQDFDQKVRDAIREHEKNYVIGIDRGERNLIYVCVINEKGSIVEQF